MAAECAKFTQVVLRLACARILENACALAVTYIHLWMYGCVNVHKYAHTHTARVAAVPFSHFFCPLHTHAVRQPGYRRPLHWVLKIGCLEKSLDFFEKVLGMKVHRHEEFASGCEATCNGPYGGAWSKTMIGNHI